MLSYCLKCEKNTKEISLLVSKAMAKQQYYQNVLYVVIKKQDLFKNKKQKGY